MVDKIIARVTECIISEHLQIAESWLFFYETRYCAQITYIDATANITTQRPDTQI